MSVTPGSYDTNVAPGDVRDAFDREDVSDGRPAEDTDGNERAQRAIDDAVAFAGPRIYDDVTPRTFDAVVAYMAAEYLYSGTDGATDAEGNKIKSQKSGSDKISYFEDSNGEGASEAGGGLFSSVAAARDTSNRLFQRTVNGFVI